LIVFAALTAVIVMSWIYIRAGAGMGMAAWDMSSLKLALGHTKPMAMLKPEPMAMPMPMAAMATPAGWDLGYTAIMVVMWWVMMIAMMLPSAAPMILVYAAIDRRQRRFGGRTRLSTSAFASGYIAAWGGFSVIAAALQWAFEHAGVLSPKMMNTTSLLFAGGLLVIAGLYQLTPVKRACLKNCRSPLQYLTGYWRNGVRGAFLMGVEHGAFCLGCCWALMALLFFWRSDEPLLDLWACAARRSREVDPSRRCGRQSNGRAPRVLGGHLRL
jgi:predicted metal-binding membrane protein